MQSIEGTECKQNCANGTTHERQLLGADHFVRNNPKSDKFEIHRFHHIEFYCGDAMMTKSRFQLGFGMNLVAKSDMSTGNRVFSSYVLQTGSVRFVFTAPYCNADISGSHNPNPSFSSETARQFFHTHGFGARCIGIHVSDAAAAYNISVANGAVGIVPPQTSRDAETNTECTISEIRAYGDANIRWISGSYSGPYLPGYHAVAPSNLNLNYGIQRLDHVVGNVPRIFDATDYLMSTIGLHEFCEFIAADVGTLSSGLNSMVVASNDEYVLMPINEPTHGTPVKSQIQEYLEQYNGAGVQHIALKSANVIQTARQMKQAAALGGFEFLPAPPPTYYQRVEERIGKGILTSQELMDLQELGILADKDDAGVLLQVFTKPLADRMTIFIEIIQRIGCDKDVAGNQLAEQLPACGGFGKGNFGALFKSIEDYQMQLEHSKEKGMKAELPC